MCGAIGWFYRCPPYNSLFAPTDFYRRPPPANETGNNILLSKRSACSHVGDGLGRSCGLLRDLVSACSSFSVSLSLSRDILSSSVRSFTWVRLNKQGQGTLRWIRS